MLTPAERAAHDRHRPHKACGTPCHAPSNSMYIGIGGMITACCVNRTYLLGRYPMQSLEQAWFGQARKDLETSIAAGDLGKGCQVCYHAIRSGNYAGLSARVYDGLSSTTNYPRKIDFELSNKCNLECIMCRGERSSAIRRNRERLPPIEMPYDAAFLQQLDPFIPHLEDAHFLGGEPFMIPLYQDIWERMVALNPRVEISVQTNATLLTDRVKRILESMRFAIAVSIDAIDPKLFARIRINGNLEDVVANIDYLHAYCTRKGTSMSLSYTPMTRNWHELPDVVRWCNARGLMLFFNTLTYPRSLALKELPSHALAEIVRFLEAASLPEVSPVEAANRHAYLHLLDLIQYWHEASLNRVDPKAPRLADDLDGYFERFRNYLEKEAPVAQQDLVYSHVRGKLERLLSTVESLGQYEVVRDYLLTVDFATLVRYVPSSTDAELLAGLRGILLAEERPG